MNYENVKMCSCMGTQGRGREASYLHSHCAGPGRAPAGEDTAAPEILVENVLWSSYVAGKCNTWGNWAHSYCLLPLTPPGLHPVWLWSLYELRSSYRCYLWPNSGQQSSDLLHAHASRRHSPPLGGDEHSHSLTGLLLLRLS